MAVSTSLAPPRALPVGATFTPLSQPFDWIESHSRAEQGCNSSLFLAVPLCWWLELLNCFPRRGHKLDGE